MNNSTLHSSVDRSGVVSLSDHQAISAGLFCAVSRRSSLSGKLFALGLERVHNGRLVISCLRGSVYDV